MHGSSFQGRHFVAKELLKLNNIIGTCLIRVKTSDLSIEL